MTMSISTWPFYRIALLVTGKGEAQFLPALFQSLVSGRPGITRLIGSPGGVGPAGRRPQPPAARTQASG
jgi:hypothetical protein